MLIDTLCAHVRLPGATSRKHFTYLVRKWSGKKEPKADDYLLYAFEHAAFLGEPNLQAILRVLRELGFADVPARCKVLSTERFNHAPAILNQFQVYAASYRPNKLGALPAVFKDIATLDDYRTLHLDAFGMAAEVKVLERHLLERGIVCIVDTTNFHPELGAVVMEEKIKEDVEKTREVWGDYVRPHERLVRSFARRLMEGAAAEELRDYSLVCVRKPGKLDKIWETLIRKFLGIDINLTPDLGLINKVLSDLTLHDENVLLVVDAESVKDLEQYRQFVGLLQRYHIKVILRMREPLPGLPQVLIQPFMDDEIAGRLLTEEPALRRTLGLEEPLSPDIFEFAAALVKRTRRPDQDNLNLVLHTLNGAAQHARMEGYRGLTEQDVAAAAPSIFHLPDGEQIRHRKTAVDKFMVRAPLEVLGQEQAIRTVGARMKSHVLGVRDVDRPLALLLPGPTGVGKTELMMKFALAMNMPFFHVEGAQFSESHTVARLIGSPSGYVGPDKGILYVFAEENAAAIVFFDEIEKMHPDVYTALMNYFDAGILTAGNGETVRRPGHVIVGAANAGAERLHRHMSERQVKDVLAEAFTDRYGNRRPELVRRFEAIPMLALEQEHFRTLLRCSLQTLGKRFGFINANLRLVGVEDSAVELLYEASREVCAYSEEGLRRIGFGDGAAAGVRVSTLAQLAAQRAVLRHAAREPGVRAAGRRVGAAVRRGAIRPRLAPPSQTPSSGQGRRRPGAWADCAGRCQGDERAHVQRAAGGGGAGRDGTLSPQRQIQVGRALLQVTSGSSNSSGSRLHMTETEWQTGTGTRPVTANCGCSHPAVVSFGTVSTGIIEPRLLDKTQKGKRVRAFPRSFGPCGSGRGVTAAPSSPPATAAAGCAPGGSAPRCRGRTARTAPTAPVGGGRRSGSTRPRRRPANTGRRPGGPSR